MASESSGFSAAQLVYIEWLATPKRARAPKTQVEFGAAIGRSDRTLQRWQKLPGFWDAVFAICRQRMKERLPDAYGALVRKAAKGEFQHLKLLFEMAGEYQERAIGTENDPLVILIKNADDRADVT